MENVQAPGAPLSDQSARQRESGALFFLSAFTLGQAMQVNSGAMHPVAIGWLGLTLMILLAALAAMKQPMLPRLSKIPLVWIAAGCLAIQWVELMSWGVRWCARDGGSVAWLAGALVVAGVGVVMLVRSAKPRAAGLALLVVGHGLAGAYAIRAVPVPKIDVWHFQQTGMNALLHGQNPYESIYRNVYDPDTRFYGPKVVSNGWLTNGIPYPPLSLLIDLPGYLLGDVRWSSLIVLELSAILLALAAPKPYGHWAAAMLLLMPRSLLVVQMAWTETHVILMFVLTLYVARSAPKWLWLALGLLLASKQYTILMLPLALLQLAQDQGKAHGSQSVGFRGTLLKALLVAALITLPFVLWNPAAFWRSIVLMQVRQPFRDDALSFNALLAWLAGVRIDAGIGFILAGAALLWACRRAERTAAGFAGANALIFALFFAFNKQAFCNYYYLVYAICCCAAAFAPASIETPVTERSQDPERSLTVLAGF